MKIKTKSGGTRRGPSILFAKKFDDVTGINDGSYLSLRERSWMMQNAKIDKIRHRVIKERCADMVKYTMNRQYHKLYP